MAFCNICTIAYYCKKAQYRNIALQGIRNVYEGGRGRAKLSPYYLP